MSVETAVQEKGIVRSCSDQTDEKKWRARSGGIEEFCERDTYVRIPLYRVYDFLVEIPQFGRGEFG